MAISIKAFLGALLCLLVLMWAGSRPAAALPMHAALVPGKLVAAETQSAAPTKVHYRHRSWRGRHWRGRNWGHRRSWRYRRGPSVWYRTGPIFGGYVGVPYGGYGYYPGYYYGRAPLPPRGYYGRPVPGTPDWYAYCASKYKSFNPRTGLYLAYSGKYRRCR